MTRRAFLLFAAILIPAAVLPAETVTPLKDGWRIESACKVQAGGDAITRAGFQVEGWLTARVPSTVLAAQVAAGVFPDPYFSDNLRKIPGTSYPVGRNFANLPMPEDSPYRCGWWYRDTFATPAASMPDEHFWLHFGGINYRADIWLNGHRIADTNTIAGAYRTYDLDVTGLLRPGKVNVVAVEVFAPTEKDLGINWVDWNPCPPDKDMGLWGPVELVTGGPVQLRAPMVATQFHDGDLNTAYLTVYAEVHNASDRAVKGLVQGSAARGHFEQAVELAPHEDRTMVFTAADFPALEIHHPQLWWPYQMGEPHLERLTMSFSAGGRKLDEQTSRFGIREITSELTAAGNRLFRVNGKRILIRGGGWSPDMLLRADDERLRAQFRMVRDLHLNTLRLEGKLETDDFFRLADQQGILVMAGWCCCDHWERWATWTPEDMTIAAESLRAQMLHLRGHPSLLAWLNGSDNPPPAEVENKYLAIESETHWPNPILSSASAKPATTGKSGVRMPGPYDYVEPSYWYLGTRYGGAFGFNTETSPGPAIPSLASRKKFLKDAEAWPPAAEWELHFGGGNFRNSKIVDAAMAGIYGSPKNAAEYTRVAQTMEYDSERAMFEAYSRNKYDSTGVIQWMLNNAWPSMIWHLYDYYLDAGAGYFAVKKACEPIHIQYSYDDRSIVVVNSTYQQTSGLRAAAQVYDVHWNKLYSDEKVVDAASDSSQRVLDLPKSLQTGAARILFIQLTLTDAAGRVVSRNFYWVPEVLTTFDWAKSDYKDTPAARYEDLSTLTHLPQAAVTAHAEMKNTAGSGEIHLHLKNTSGALAFQISAAVRTAQGALIAPVLWSDNWIELAPHGSTTLTALLPKDAPLDARVELDGWNIEKAIVTPHRGAAH